MSGPASCTSTSSPGLMTDMSKLTSTASGIGSVASRHIRPSCSLVYARVSAGASSTVTSPRFAALATSMGPIGPPPRDIMGWSPTAADTWRK